MLRFLGQLADLPVLSQRQNARVATIRGWVVNPDKGKVEAYAVRRDGQIRYLSTVDVIAYLSDGVVVADQEALQPLEELVRVKRLRDRSVKLIGQRVVTDKGRRLGRVKDALIETDGHFLAKLHVRPGWINRLWHHELIIPREQVLRVTSREVVVRYDVKAPTAEVEPEIIQ